MLFNFSLDISYLFRVLYLSSQLNQFILYFSAQCTNYTSCNSCTNNFCYWCYEGTSTSTIASCTSSSEPCNPSYAYYYSSYQCLCENYTSCSSCTNATIYSSGCYWCDPICYFYGQTCSRNSYRYQYECTGNDNSYHDDSQLKFIIAIIVTVIIVIIVISCIFIYRRRHKTSYSPVIMPTTIVSPYVRSVTCYKCEGSGYLKLTLENRTVAVSEMIICSNCKGKGST